jgi:predicted AAA+ superfamily ATPase
MENFFKQSEILNILQGFNPWWSDKPSIVPAFKRIAFEVCYEYLKNTKLKRAILLSGPRRVGKTTVLQQIAHALIQNGSNPKSILYLSLDHPLLKLLSLREILKLYHEIIFPEGQQVILLLDEIQYSEEWQIEVKILVDHHLNYRIVATGSASVARKEELAESGVGRWITIPVPTLTFYEFIPICGETRPDIKLDLKPNDLFTMSKAEYSDLILKLRPLLPLFQKYLLVGGFPETAKIGSIQLCQRLLREDVIERVLKRDMTALFGVRNVNDLEKLFIYLCIYTGGILGHNTIAKVLETTSSTVSNHLTLLEQANLIYCLPPMNIGGKKVLKARNKYYLVDAALRNAILLLGEEVLSNSREMGLIIETTVFKHLYAYYYKDIPKIGYWRDSATEKEVDIIVESPAYKLPIEIKYQEQAALEKSGGLVTYCTKEKIKKAYLVTKSEQDIGVFNVEGTDTQFLKIPAHIFCYLLGQAERLLWK